MRNRCILGLLMVFGISLVSVVAFANSFTGEPAKKTDRVEIITQAAVSEEKNVAPYETPAATEIPPTATPYAEQDEETCQHIPLVFIWFDDHRKIKGV